MAVKIVHCLKSSAVPYGILDFKNLKTAEFFFISSCLSIKRLILELHTEMKIESINILAIESLF